MYSIEIDATNHPIGSIKPNTYFSLYIGENRHLTKIIIIIIIIPNNNNNNNNNNNKILHSESWKNSKSLEVVKV